MPTDQQTKQHRRNAWLDILDLLEALFWIGRGLWAALALFWAWVTA